MVIGHNFDSEAGFERACDGYLGHPFGYMAAEEHLHVLFSIHFSLPMT